MLAGLAAPVLAVQVPPLTDYPDQVWRAVLSWRSARRTRVLRTMFSPHWELIPNLAIDLILPPLMACPPLLAGRLVVLLAVLLPATGAIALSRACFGRLSLWQLGVGFVAYNAIFLIGMLNFQLAAGVALWGAAAWVAGRDHHPVRAVLTGAGFATVAFVFHMFGLLFFALLIGCAELAAIARRWPGTAERSRPGCAAWPRSGGAFLDDVSRPQPPRRQSVRRCGVAGSPDDTIGSAQSARGRREIKSEPRI